ncbi:hypothetical protein FPV67DRAFT_1671224 [Lyophyllum atratum]|nr:hypothetical protein FPV67DRAFT_1671224 [Lyophyllum atratum]
MSELILLTGASGFVGSHIAMQLLDKRYRVRATARGAKVAELRNNCAKFGDKFEVVEVSDIGADQFPDAFKGVDAVVHSAASLPERQSADIVLKSALDGTINVTVTQPAKTELQNGHLPRRQNPRRNGTLGLRGSSSPPRHHFPSVFSFLLPHSLGSGQHNIPTVNPPYLHGPFAEAFTLPPGAYYAMSTNLHIYRLLHPSGHFPASMGHADVRDIVLALSSPPSSTSSSTSSQTHTHRIPAPLKDRLTKKEPPAYPGGRIPIDFGRVEETVLGAVDSVLGVEREWVKQGHQVDIPQEG